MGDGCVGGWVGGWGASVEALKGGGTLGFPRRVRGGTLGPSKAKKTIEGLEGRGSVTSEGASQVSHAFVAGGVRIIF